MFKVSNVTFWFCAWSCSLLARITTNKFKRTFLNFLSSSHLHYTAKLKAGWEFPGGPVVRAFLVAYTVNNVPEMQENRVWSLGWEDPLETDTATHSSILAWRIPTDRPWAHKESDTTEWLTLCVTSDKYPNLSESISPPNRIAKGRKWDHVSRAFSTVPSMSTNKTRVSVQYVLTISGQVLFSMGTWVAKSRPTTGMPCVCARADLL